MLHWCLEAPPETERVWGGLCKLLEDVQHPEGHELLCPHCGLPLEIIIEMPK
jgi:hypothetical protein